MVVAELQSEHAQGRPFLVRVALILISICGLFVRVRPPR